ncbi:TerD family protein [Caldichromatium japonicum]|nr:TerD family protein [Caldichromatium japonicum]
MMNLARGQRIKLIDLIPGGQRLNIGVSIEAAGMAIDVACFGLDAQGRLADECYMVFYNQPASPCGGVSLITPAGDQSGFTVDLTRLPATIERLTVTAAIDGPGIMAQIRQGYVRILDGSREAARFAFSGSDFANERALVLVEIYRKEGLWRLAALGQGFNGGLAALIEHFGGTVAPEPQAPPSHPPSSPPVNLRKITLEKQGQSVSLEKKGAGHGEILVNLRWRPVARARQGLLGGLLGSGRTDLDLGCLFELTNGMKSAVQALGNTFGDYFNPPYIRLDADDRTGTRAEGENLRINGQHWDAIKRVLIYAFIYEGAPNWAEADAAITLRIPDQPEVEVRLDTHRHDRPMCAIALLENDRGAIKVTKRVEYYRGHLDMDRAYSWGLQWVRGSKD